MSQNISAFDSSIGGTRTANGITAAALINPRRCTLNSMHVVAPGTSGTLTINDAASLDGANESNIIFSHDFSDLTAGQLIPLQWPVQSGIVVSAVPTGGSINLAFTFGPYGA